MVSEEYSCRCRFAEDFNWRLCIAAVGTLMLSLSRATIRTSVFARLHCPHASLDVFHMPREDQTAQRGGVMDELPCVSGSSLGCPTCPTSFAICKESEWSDASGSRLQQPSFCSLPSAFSPCIYIEYQDIVPPIARARNTSPEQDGCSMHPIHSRTLDREGGLKLG